MIGSSHHWFIYPFFIWYTRIKIHRNFRSVKISGKFTDRNLPVLLLANHIGWWDGFWAMYLNINIFRRTFYFMMLEEQLAKFRFFTRTGGFPVRKGSRSIIESLNYAISVLTDKRNMLLFFPQGHITSVYNRHFNFETGLGYIMKAVQGKVHVIFLANFIEFLSDEKPTLYMDYTEYTGGSRKAGEIASAYQDFYNRMLDEKVTNIEK